MKVEGTHEASLQQDMKPQGGNNILAFVTPSLHLNCQEAMESHLVTIVFWSLLSRMTDGPFSTTCRIHGSSNIHGGPTTLPEDTYTLEDPDKSPTFRPFQHTLPHCSPEVHRTCWCVNYIAEHTRLKEGSTKVKEDWKYVAMVLDRLFLWIFTLAVLVGTAGIILQAPSLYDDREPLDKELSEVYQTHLINAKRY
ncbi:hypothetical protein Pcinc_010423 [Petrolisthes cinctipes]|uniref:Neurotransmitter-gated ion-channel transmembrane domain-containing protein n=1 Tax=Petrolisthes cinctipes TaxID=88211 RepID=A0AAE1G2T8_PETCI|nr:hypothetical protein Pcinc_010423 [Petrolisthes cinctipes]